MPAFTADEVRRLAALAKLELAPEEVETFVRQLAEILEFARQVQSVDTMLVAAADDSLLSAASPLREDNPEPSLPRGDVLAAAPDGDATDGLLKVPRVLSG